MTAIEFNHKLEGLSQYLRPFALKLTRDNEAANDLMQETMVKAISNKDKFAEGTNMKAWMYTIMRNTFITAYHRTVRRKTFIDTTDNLHYINSSGQITSNGANSKFVIDDVDEAVNELKKEYSRPFLMHFRGFKYHEIAEKLEIPIGTVKNRIHIARKLLKSRLQVYAMAN